ncbi:hypothetical protein [Lactobacillus sp. PV037]|uniref:hypothetical protein n=1 Tax=Lactobacillus sp. PV037 TaxID=2594496 RepID=UPI00223F7FFB|nr:hypothetical protein [Lactobacillus sp. PV037]
MKRLRLSTIFNEISDMILKYRMLEKEVKEKQSTIRKEHEEMKKEFLALKKKVNNRMR